RREAAADLRRPVHLRALHAVRRLACLRRSDRAPRPAHLDRRARQGDVGVARMNGADSNAGDATARFGSGRAVHRVEDAALLAGRGRFVDNVAEPGQTIVAFQRSPHAHARIVAVEVDAARAMPGVLAVYTGADLAAAGIQPMPTTPDFRRA